MIKIKRVVLAQNMGPMPVYVKAENCENGKRSIDAHISRLSPKCCGTVELDETLLTDEDIDKIINGKINVLPIVTPTLTMELYMVEFLNEGITAERLRNGTQLTFVSQLSHIRSLQILNIAD